MKSTSHTSHEPPVVSLLPLGNEPNSIRHLGQELPARPPDPRPRERAPSTTLDFVARKTDTRERLIDAAIEVIEAEGEQAIKMGAIADAVGVSAPSIYHFFSDREALIVEAFAEMYRRAQAVVMTSVIPIAEEADTPEKFQAIMKLALESTAEDDGIRRREMYTSVLGAAVRRPELQNKLVELNRLNAARNQTFAELGRERGFVHENFDFRVLGLFATAVTASRHYADIDDDVDHSEWDAILHETFRHLLFDKIDRQRNT